MVRCECRYASTKRSYELNNNNLSWNAYGFAYSDDPNKRDKPLFDNPYYMRHQNFSTDSRDRFIGNVVLNYEINDVFNIMGRITNDNFSELREERIGLTVDVPSYRKYTKSYYERNYDLFLNFDKDLNEKLNLFGMVGTNIRRSSEIVTDGSTNGGLVALSPFFSNSVNTPEAPTEFTAKEQLMDT